MEVMSHPVTSTPNQVLSSALSQLELFVQLAPLVELYNATNAARWAGRHARSFFPRQGWLYLRNQRHPQKAPNEIEIIMNGFIHILRQ